MDNMTAPTAAPSNIITIEPREFAKFAKKFATLNRKAIKLGLPEVTFTSVERTKIVEVGTQTREVVVIDVTLTGQAPRIDGWNLVCKVEHTEAGQLVKQPAGCNEDLSAWYECSGRTCDHCHTDRDRTVTFVLRNEADGRIVRIGRSCLADFVRDVNAVKVINSALWEDFVPQGDDGPRCYTYSTHMLVSVAVAVIRADKGQYLGERTRGAVSFALSNPPEEKEAFEAWKEIQPTAEDRAVAATVIEWAKQQSGSDYLHNLAVACSSVGIGATRNLLISAPHAYARAHNTAAQAASKAAPLVKILPKTGRYEVTGVVKTLRTQESDYGTTEKMLLTIDVTEGTWNAWISVPAGLNDLEVGQTVTLTATVEPKEVGFAILKRPAKASVK
jgi:hypothetical protein